MMNKGGRPSLATSLRRDRYLYLLVLPAVAWLILFRYVPIYGITMAFQDFTIKKGYFGSPFVGLKHFLWLINREDFMLAFWNTWIINILRIIVGFPAPVLLALMINESRNRAFKRTVQTLSYLPHFISWVVLSGIFNSLLARDSGALNGLVALLGLPRQDFLQSNAWFRWVLIVTEVWKEVGWSTIIYLAAISAINPELYESAIVDGAGRGRQVLSITVPLLAPTMIVILILRLGSVLNVGFEQVFNLYNPLVYESGDIIDTWVVRSLQSGSANFSRLAAAGVVKNLIGMALLLGANRLVRLFGREGLY